LKNTKNLSLFIEERVDFLKSGFFQKKMGLRQNNFFVKKTGKNGVNFLVVFQVFFQFNVFCIFPLMKGIKIEKSVEKVFVISMVFLTLFLDFSF
jgi:hypothetical protein